MPVKSFRPTTPTRRFQTVVSREDITKQTPEKSLVRGKRATGGRTSTGRISSRFRGGGHKKAYREIDFKRNKHGIVAVVAARERISAEELKQHLLHSLPAWQLPREWQFVDSLPTNERGKISRAEWLQRYLTGEIPSPR